MLQQINSTLKSREFQTAAAKMAGMVVTLVVSTAVTSLVNKGIDAGIEIVMDKIHGTDKPAE